MLPLLFQEKNLLQTNKKNLLLTAGALLKVHRKATMH